MPDAVLPATFLQPLLRVMAQQLGGAVILHEAPSGRILMVAGAIPGLDVEDPIGARPDDYDGRFQVFAQDGSVAQMQALPVVRVIATGEAVTDEVWLIGAEDRAPPVPVFVDSHPLKDDQGGVIGVIAIATDPKRWGQRAERMKQSISTRGRLTGP